LFITPGEEGGFLAPLPVTYLPLDPQLARRFQLLGLRTLGQFAILPAGAVLNQFGRHGRRLHQLAQGYDDRPVMAHPSQPMEQSTTQLDDPVINRTVLTALSRAMVTKLAARLEARGQVARGLYLALHLEDETHWEKQTILRQPTNSPERLARYLEMFIEHAQVSGGTMAVVVKLTGLTATRAEQLPLLAVPAHLQQEKRLVELLPDLVARYGPDCFYQVTLTNPLAGLLERRFQIREVTRR
jgi:nucleotidyltransferase/DNA polymerase involved in DNA repair